MGRTGAHVRGFRLNATMVGMAGLAVFVVGGTLLGTSMAASASGPTLSLSPSSITSTSVVAITLTGTGYPVKATGFAFICPEVTGQPTVPVRTFGDWPVGCEGYSIAIEYERRSEAWYYRHARLGQGDRAACLGHRQ